MREVRQTMQDMQYEWDDAMLAKAEVVLQHAQAVQNLQDAQGALDEARIWLIEANSDIEGLKERNADILEQLEAQKRNIEEAASLTEQYRAAAREQADVLGTVLADIDEERRAEIQLLAQEEVHEEGDGADEDGVTPERPLRSTQIRHDISAEEAKLELIHTANPNVIQDFERRAGEITKLKKKMGSVSEKLAGITGKTQEIMAKFEPRLDDLVSRVNDAFAYNFEQISCAGEVRVQKTEDFEQWALIIMVKFRFVHPSPADKGRMNTDNSTHKAKMRVSNSSTPAGSLVASGPFPPFSSSWLSSPWRNRPSALSTRSTRAWTPATNAWSMSAWSRSPAASIRASTSSSRPNCSQA